MEAEAVGNDSAGTSWAIAATATGTEDSVMTNEPICDMPTERTPAGTDSQPPRPRIQYSTDLRKELSLDVLASLGGSSADDANSIQQSLLDMDTERADMDFIAELSSLGLPLGHSDSNGADTASPSAGTPIAEPHYGSESSGAPTTADISLPGDDTSLSLPGPATVDSPPSLPNNEVPGEVSLESLMNSTSSAAGALVENADTVLSPAHFTPGSATVPSISDTFYPVSSALSFVSPVEDNSRVVDAPAELQPSSVGKELPESGFAGPSVSEADVFSHVPLEPLSSSAISFPVSDGDPATVEVYDDSSNSFPSPDPALVNDAAPVHSAQFVLPPSYLPATSQPTDSAILAEPHTLAFSPVSSTLGDYAANSPQSTVDLSLAGMRSFTSCDMDLPEASVSSLQLFSSALETLLSAPARLPSSNSPMALENPPLESTSLTSAFAAPAEDSGLSGSAVFSSPPSPNNGSTPVFDSSPALNSLPLTIDHSPAVNKPDDLDLITLSTPLVTPAVSTGLPGVNPSSSTTSLVPPKVSPLRESVSSPPLTAQFWDVPKPLSPRISLSVYFDGSRSSFRGRKTNRKKRPSEAGGDQKDMKGKGLSDIEKLDEVAELESMLEAQKRMVKWQIDEIQRIATLQFQLTGSNPLSEEAMWEVLGVKAGGKKSGDALSPETLKCLQEIFAIKDTLTKKEARDISFTTGASLTQVREYFAAQRSLVRRLVQQAHDEAGRLGIKNASEQSQQIVVLNSISEIEKDLGFDKLSGAESIEKTIEAMRAEKGFAGQVQLCQVILRTDSTALILRRFLEKGGLKMLGGWLAEAATEQQTSVISHLLKVLDHLPMSNAVSHQMQPLVQNVNKLRFHEVSAVAGKATSLLSKWVKLLSPKPKSKPVSSPGSKPLAGSATPSGGLKRNRDPPAAQTVPGLRKKKVRAEEVLQQETKASPAAAVTDSPSLNGVPSAASEQTSSSPAVVSVPPPAAKQRWSSTLQPSESAVAAVSVSRKRLASKSFGDPSKDRRKLLLVEDNHLGKSPNSKPATISKTSRPLSTDDIYKAKKLERLMQEPILKSKRRAAAGPQEQPVAQDTASHSDAHRKLPSPAVQPSDLGAVKRETSSSSPGSWRGGSLTGKSIQEQPTATRSRLPMRSPESRDVKMSVAPTSSEDLLQTTITPTSPQKNSHPGFVTGHASEEVAYKRDSSLNSTAPMETDPLRSSLFGSSGQEQSDNSHYGGYSQAPPAGAGPLGLDAAAFNAISSKDQSHPFNSSQSFVSESNGSTPIVKSTPASVESIRMPPASSEPSEARLKELSGLSVLRGVMNLVDKSAMDVTGSKDKLGTEQELGRGNDIKPSPREASLSDFYAALRASMVRWRVPPEYHPDRQWNVSAGDDSKEREVQSGRVKREEEAYYPELSGVPDDPKDPWEEEPNYDDSLTLEIFVDSGQRKVFTEVNNPSDISKPTAMNVVLYGPEAAPIGADVLGNTILNSAPNSNQGQQLAPQSLSKVPPTANGVGQVFQQLSGGGGGGAHDPDLLALLLRNPELVSQLTLGQGFNPSTMANQPGVFNQPMDPLKQQLSSGGNNGAAGLSNPAAGDLGQERLITSNNSKALGIPLQPGRSVSSMDQTPPETMRVQDSIQMMPPPGMGQQQNMGFVPSQGGVVDNRYLPPQMPSSVVARNNNIQDPPGWEQQRLPPPPPLPPPVPPMQQPPVINQVLQQPPLPNQHNKLQPNWPEPQGWAGMGRPPPLNPPPQPRPGPEQQQLHTRQPLINHNVRLPNYVGLVGVPQPEGAAEPVVVSQPDVHNSQRPWLNGSHGGPPAHDSNAMIHSNQQESGASRNNRWQPRPPVRPPDQHVPVRPPLDQYSRPGNRDFTDFNNISRQTSVVDNRSGWVPNERARPIVPPFQQGAYALPPPPPYPAPVWQGQDQGPNVRLVQQGGGGQVNPYPHGRNPRQQQSQQQQMWLNNNVGPGSRQIWRGQQ